MFPPESTNLPLVQVKVIRVLLGTGLPRTLVAEALISVVCITFMG